MYYLFLFLVAVLVGLFAFSVFELCVSLFFSFIRKYNGKER